MALRLEPRDEYMHELGPEPNFNESMYFNLFDPSKRIGGFLRLGNRANEGYAEMTVCLYLPDGRVAFMFERPQISDNNAFEQNPYEDGTVDLTFMAVSTMFGGVPATTREGPGEEFARAHYEQLTAA